MAAASDRGRLNLEEQAPGWLERSGGRQGRSGSKEAAASTGQGWRSPRTGSASARRNLGISRQQAGLSTRRRQVSDRMTGVGAQEAEGGWMVSGRRWDGVARRDEWSDDSRVWGSGRVRASPVQLWGRTGAGRANWADEARRWLLFGSRLRCSGAGGARMEGRERE